MTDDQVLILRRLTEQLLYQPVTTPALPLRIQLAQVHIGVQRLRNHRGESPIEGTVFNRECVKIGSEAGEGTDDSGTQVCWPRLGCCAPRYRPGHQQRPCTFHDFWGRDPLHAKPDQPFSLGSKVNRRVRSFFPKKARPSSNQSSGTSRGDRLP